MKNRVLEFVHTCIFTVYVEYNMTKSAPNQLTLPLHRKKRREAQCSETNYVMLPSPATKAFRPSPFSSMIREGRHEREKNSVKMRREYSGESMVVYQNVRYENAECTT